MSPTRLLILSSLLALSLPAAQAMAKPWWMRGIDSNETDFLPPDAAFRVAARLEDGNLRVRWVIADGYYLYQAKMSVVAESPDLVVTGLSLPRGIVKTDPYLGTQEIYTQQVEGAVGYRRFDYGAHPLQIKVIYQGCAEAGLCYPPIVKVLSPAETALTLPPARRAWQGIAIVGGALGFLLAGLLLRKGRMLPLPGA